jgi:hypothetical protein
LRGAGTRGTQACSFVAARALLPARAGLTCPGSFEPLFPWGWLGWVKGDAAAWARAGSSRRGSRAGGLPGLRQQLPRSSRKGPFSATESDRS